MLEAISPYSGRRAAHRELALFLARKVPDLATRDALPAHLTASVFLVDAAGERALLEVTATARPTDAPSRSANCGRRRARRRSRCGPVRRRCAPRRAGRDRDRRGGLRDMPGEPPGSPRPPPPGRASRGRTLRVGRSWIRTRDLRLIRAAL